MPCGGLDLCIVRDCVRTSQRLSQPPGVPWTMLKAQEGAGGSPWLATLGDATPMAFPRCMDDLWRLGEEKLKDSGSRMLPFQAWCCLVGEAQSDSYLAGAWMSTLPRWDTATSLQAPIPTSWNLTLAPLGEFSWRLWTYHYKICSEINIGFEWGKVLQNFKL